MTLSVVLKEHCISRTRTFVLMDGQDLRIHKCPQLLPLLWAPGSITVHEFMELNFLCGEV